MTEVQAASCELRTVSKSPEANVERGTQSERLGERERLGPSSWVRLRLTLRKLRV